MDPNQKIDKTRRNLIVVTTAASGVAGLGAAIPFVTSMWPSERAKALGAPVEIDVSKLEPGQIAVVEWRSKPVFIIRRTPEMLESIKKSDDRVADPNSSVDQQPDYAKNEYRSIKPEIAVMEGVCTHLGCSPKSRPQGAADMGGDWAGGFYCPCHGSKFDLAGRVYQGVPAPINLRVPPYMFVSDSRIVIGEDKEGA
jgi:ubiquinol-cytochrome c reductase iron-sulfur subunit